MTSVHASQIANDLTDTGTRDNKGNPLRSQGARKLSKEEGLALAEYINELEAKLNALNQLRLTATTMVADQFSEDLVNRELGMKSTLFEKVMDKIPPHEQAFIESLIDFERRFPESPPDQSPMKVEEES